MNDGAVLIGFIITISIVGLAGGTTLIVFIIIKYKDYVKRRQILRAALPTRQTARRRRRVRVQPASNTESIHSGSFDLPPPYSENDCLPPPPYTINPLLYYDDISRGNSRRNSRLTTPQQARGRNSVLRHSSFSVHLNIEGSHTPTLVPTEGVHDPLNFNGQVVNNFNTETPTHNNSVTT